MNLRWFAQDRDFEQSLDVGEQVLDVGDPKFGFTLILKFNRTGLDTDLS